MAVVLNIDPDISNQLEDWGSTYHELAETLREVIDRSQLVAGQLGERFEGVR